MDLERGSCYKGHPWSLVGQLYSLPTCKESQHIKGANF